MYADALLPTLETLARRAAEAEGVSLGWVELKRQGSSWVLRVFIDIDREDRGVGLLDCERVSERLGVLLDVEDPIDSSYTLEVSTPGLDRPLHGESDYQRFAGKLARIQTKEALDGRRRFLGRLGGIVEGGVELTTVEGKTLRIPLRAIEKARLEVELPRREEGRRP
ncbi:MAG TPA: ribosome maturation factor RimP [Vicinamibacteria bacterium]|nr:ribosome maturation factor RimP [Vicinamibacteria bacterium]